MYNENIEVHTFDALEIQLEVAGIGARSYAFLIDWHIRLLLSLTWVLVAGFLFAFISNLSLSDFIKDLFNHNLSNTILFLFTAPLMMIYFLYHMILEIYFKGATPGKRMAGIRIVTESGQTPELGALFIRNVFRLVDSLPAFYVIGLFTCFLSDRQRRFGDMAAGTVLIYEKTNRKKDFNSVSSLAAQSQSTLVDRELAQELLERWSELEIDSSTRLATVLLKRLGIPVPENNGYDLNRLLRKQIEQFVDT